MLAESETAEPGTGRKFEKSFRWALIALWMIGPLATLHFQIEAKSGFRVALRQGLGHPNAELVVGRISVQERPHSPLPVPGWEDRTRREKSHSGSGERRPRIGFRHIAFATAPLHLLR